MLVNTGYLVLLHLFHNMYFLQTFDNCRDMPRQGPRQAPRQPSRHVAVRAPVATEHHGTTHGNTHGGTYGKTRGNTCGSRGKNRGNSRGRLHGKYRCEQGDRWASGGSWGGLITFLRPVGVSRVPNGMDLLRGQSNRVPDGVLPRVLSWKLPRVLPSGYRRYCRGDCRGMPWQTPPQYPRAQPWHVPQQMGTREPCHDMPRALPRKCQRICIRACNGLSKTVGHDKSDFRHGFLRPPSS